MPCAPPLPNTNTHTPSRHTQVALDAELDAVRTRLASYHERYRDQLLDDKASLGAELEALRVRGWGGCSGRTGARAGNLLVQGAAGAHGQRPAPSPQCTLHSNI